MHFAVGMGCGGAAFAAGCLLARRGWRWLPLAMTAGGFWALVPDMPRLFREDFPSLPLAATLGAKPIEDRLHAIGDLFFFHHRLDAQPHEMALHGLVLMLLFYNAAIILLMLMQRPGTGGSAAATMRASRSRRAEATGVALPTSSAIADGRT